MNINKTLIINRNLNVLMMLFMENLIHKIITIVQIKNMTDGQ